MTPRLAGISAFGVGGTNAHVIVEEPPLAQPTGVSRKQQLITLSARTTTALDAMSKRLADHLASASPDLADVSHTLTGRRGFPLRRSIVAADLAEAVAKLREEAKSVTAPAKAPRVAFLFPGQGSQYVGMGREIYDSEPAASPAHPPRRADHAFPIGTGA
jgi:phthiocerol/phenolphthiocerol synthesis type-I polyketide synthase E